MKIVAGLGNPGGKYTFTRHNAGFLFIDYMSQKYNFSVVRSGFKSLYGETRIKGERVIFIKPQTFMNLSGQAVLEISSYYKVDTADIIVVYDDVSLVEGGLRIRLKGSDGGHNGIKSIIQCLGKDDFPRIKIGVGAPPHKDYDLADWVLSEFPKSSHQTIFETIELAAKACEDIIAGETEQVMGRYNRKSAIMEEK